MRAKGVKRSEKAQAIFQIANLVVAIIAFSFMISLASGSVSAQDETQASIWSKIKNYFSKMLGLSESGAGERPVPEQGYEPQAGDRLGTWTYQGLDNGRYKWVNSNPSIDEGNSEILSNDKIPIELQQKFPEEYNDLLRSGSVEPPAATAEEYGPPAAQPAAGTQPEMTSEEAVQAAMAGLGAVPGSQSGNGAATSEDAVQYAMDRMSPSRAPAPVKEMNPPIDPVVRAVAAKETIGSGGFIKTDEGEIIKITSVSKDGTVTGIDKVGTAKTLDTKFTDATELAKLKATDVSTLDAMNFGKAVDLGRGVPKVPVNDYLSGTAKMTPEVETKLGEMGFKDIDPGKSFTQDSKSYTIGTGGELTPVDIAEAPTIPLIGVQSYIFGHLVQGVIWAGVVVGVIQLVGSLAGADRNLINTLSMAAFGGIMAGKIITGIKEK